MDLGALRPPGLVEIAATDHRAFRQPSSAQRGEIEQDAAGNDGRCGVDAVPGESCRRLDGRCMSSA
jgi:hypothetical protein